MSDKGATALVWLCGLGVCAVIGSCLGTSINQKSDTERHQEAIKREAGERLNQEQEVLRKVIYEAQVQEEMERQRKKRGY